MLLDRQAELGGMQRLNFLPNEWVLGIPGRTGPELADQYAKHAGGLGIRIAASSEVLAIRRQPTGFLVRFNDGNGVGGECAAKALIIATGTHPRGVEALPGVTGVGEAGEDLVHGPYAFSDLDVLAGRRVLIVGGGDNAFENAKRLARIASKITLLIRSRPRAQAAMLAAVRECENAGNCELIEEARLRAIRREADGLHVTVSVRSDSRTLACDRIHVLIGYEPNTEFLPGLLKDGAIAPVQTDADGYIVVDDMMRTSSPGIYAAGDVCNPKFPSVVAAIGQGAMAAKTIEMDVFK